MYGVGRQQGKQGPARMGLVELEIKIKDNNFQNL